MQPIVTRLVALLPLLQVGVLAVGTLVSFLIAYFQNDVTIYLPFISENGAIIPEMGIFSATLIAGSFVGFFTVAYRFLLIMYIHDQQGNVRTFLKSLNILALLSGLGSMAGLAGVAAFPMSTILVVHLIVAGIHFSLAMVYLFLNTYLSYKTQSSNHPPSFMKVRIALCILLTIFLILLAIFMPLGYFKWKKLHPNVRHAMKTPNMEGFSFVFVGALFEWLLYVSFVAYILSFTGEFRKFQLVISVEPVETRLHENIDNSNREQKATTQDSSEGRTSNDT